MTLAFIIAAVIAGILFFLWESGRDKLIDADGKISQLKNRIEELANDPSKAAYVKQTPLTIENQCDVVRNNGLIPLQNEEDWIGLDSSGKASNTLFLAILFLESSSTRVFPITTTIWNS